MTEGPGRGERAAVERAVDRQPHLSWRDRLGVVQRRLLRQRAARTALAVNDAYGSAGGGLLAAGLAFSALFAIIPALLTLIGVLGFFISDAETRQSIVDSLVSQFPPLAPVAREIIDSLASASGLSSVIGLIGVVWGASAFYGALDGALSRLFPGSRARGPVEQRIRGIIGVLLLVAAALVAFVTGSFLSVVASYVRITGIDLLPLLGLLFAALGAFFVTWFIYVVVPRDGPSWRAAMFPALAAGIGIGALTALFGLISPFLVRGFSALGIIASVFVALVWFNLIFQLLLYGAAWARLRRDRERLPTEAPRI